MRGRCALALLVLALAWRVEGETYVSGSCLQNQFQCRDDKCIPQRWRCDGDSDCPDGEDEDACPRDVVCSGFQCTDGRCVSLKRKCDGHVDCADGSDEDSLTCGTFRCRDGELVSTTAVCDGHGDCADGSDEETCPPGRCSPAEFLCGPDCRPSDVLCDGKIDCPGGQDEAAEVCGREPEPRCPADEFGCDGRCVPLAWRCDGHTDCEDGSDEENCSSLPVLLVFNSSTIVKMDLNGQRREEVPFVSSVAALSWASSEIFLVDGEERVVSRRSLDASGTTTTTTTTRDIGPAACVCVDWVYNLVFWIDPDSKTIRVAALDGSKQKILHKGNISLPGAMAVDPMTGYIFWSDMGDEPKIEKAAMNGADRGPLVTSNIRRPVAVTLDVKRRLVYWVDAELNAISKMSMDGQRRGVVLYSADLLAHPSGIAVFEDRIFWCDRRRGAVYSMPERLRANATQVTSLSRPSGVLILAKELQPEGVNLCLERGAACSFLCVPSPGPERSQAYSCLNPDSPSASYLPEAGNATNGEEKTSFYTRGLVFILPVFFSASLIFCVLLYNRNQRSCRLLNARLFETSKKYLKPDLDRTASSTYMLTDLKTEEDDV